MWRRHSRASMFPTRPKLMTPEPPPLLWPTWVNLANINGGLRWSRLQKLSPHKRLSLVRFSSFYRSCSLFLVNSCGSVTAPPTGPVYLVERFQWFGADTRLFETILCLWTWSEPHCLHLCPSVKDQHLSGDEAGRARWDRERRAGKSQVGTYSCPWVLPHFTLSSFLLPPATWCLGDIQPWCHGGAAGGGRGNRHGDGHQSAACAEEAIRHDQPWHRGGATPD